MLDREKRGRGDIATADMKARIARLKRLGYEVDEILTILWDRSLEAEFGHGYRYEFAPPDEV